MIAAANETHSTLTDPLLFTPATQGGSLGISWGADRFNDNVDGGVSATSGQTGDRSVVFADAVVDLTGHLQGGEGASQTASFATLTSRGDAVHFALLNNGTVLMAYTGSEVPGIPVPGSGGDSEGGDGPQQVDAEIVFIVTLSDASNSGSYVITQYQPLDHSAGAQTFDSVDLSFHFTATDSDGDPVSGTLTTTVLDPVPVAHTGNQATVEDESAGSSGNNETESPNLSASVFGVSLNIDWGADNANDNNGQPGDRAVAFTDADVVVSGAYGAALTSLGQDVHFTLLPDGALVGYTGATIPTSTGDADVVLFCDADRCQFPRQLRLHAGRAARSRRRRWREQPVADLQLHRHRQRRRHLVEHLHRQCRRRRDDNRQAVRRRRCRGRTAGRGRRRQRGRWRRRRWRLHQPFVSVLP